MPDVNGAYAPKKMLLLLHSAGVGLGVVGCCEAVAVVIECNADAVEGIEGVAVGGLGGNEEE